MAGTCLLVNLVIFLPVGVNPELLSSLRKIKLRQLPKKKERVRKVSVRRRWLSKLPRKQLKKLKN